ncbi:hypothetical protein [Amycolatopsis sp. H20-H5]|uniref:hypothetical protein n=1 Tax=Amycolatopsis sp. H20-H5 TaxID=3046309 RepID=UPI002DB6A4B0|nr:hypothetical protein [Amycolatopsis sp. H20-H5]MEC3979303.1 hypothetical protein [Amycolatopsis sp. H20-H5]
MSGRKTGTWARWALLCALAWGVVAMHHVGTAQPGHSMDDPAPAAMVMVAAPGLPAADPAPMDPGMHHDPLHLCLAVLGALAGLAVVLWLLGVVGAVAPSLAQRVRRPGPSRPPPSRRGREILLTACVLRV